MGSTLFLLASRVVSVDSNLDTSAMGIWSWKTICNKKISKGKKFIKNYIVLNLLICKIIFHNFSLNLSDSKFFKLNPFQNNKFRSTIYQGGKGNDKRLELICIYACSHTNEI